MKYRKSILLQSKEEWFSWDPGMNVNGPYVLIIQVGEELISQTQAVLSFTLYT
jgi:hypothetical protein